MLAISVEGGALVALKSMLPHVDKKRGQVKAAIDYLEDKLTGDEFIARINAEFEGKKGVPPEGPSCQEDRGSLARRVRDCRSGPLWQRLKCD